MTNNPNDPYTVLDILLRIDQHGELAENYCIETSYFPVPDDIYVEAIEFHYETGTRQNGIWHFPVIQLLRSYGIPVCHKAREKLSTLPQDNVFKHEELCSILLDD